MAKKKASEEFGEPSHGKYFLSIFSRNHQILQVNKKKRYPYVSINNNKMLNLVGITCSFLIHVLQIINKCRRMKNSYMERSYPIIQGKKKKTLPDCLWTFMQKLWLWCILPSDFLVHTARAESATRNHITTELSTTSLQIICNQEGKGKVVLNPHP